MGKREDKFLVLDADGKARIVTETQMYEELLYSARKRGDELRDAAEFEAKVAAKLASNESNVDLELQGCCGYRDICLCPERFSLHLDCNFFRLKWARLTVEEEMDDRK